MKTSNKIIVSFFLFVWLTLMLTLLISFKMSDQKDYHIEDSHKTEINLIE
jgi:Na+(H+)/acetate symporter ActP